MALNLSKPISEFTKLSLFCLIENWSSVDVKCYLGAKLSSFPS